MTSIYEVKGDKAHDIYKWAKINYGTSSIPKWNFHKIIMRFFNFLSSFALNRADNQSFLSV